MQCNLNILSPVLRCFIEAKGVNLYPLHGQNNEMKSQQIRKKRHRTDQSIGEGTFSLAALPENPLSEVRGGRWPTTSNSASVCSVTRRRRFPNFLSLGAVVICLFVTKQQVFVCLLLVLLGHLEVPVERGMPDLFLALVPLLPAYLSIRLFLAIV